MKTFKTLLNELGASMIGLTVMVATGPHKGKTGKIVHDDFLNDKVELITKSGKIVVDMFNIEFVED